MIDPRDMERLRDELALQIEGELARGIHFWTDPDLDAIAREFLAGSGRPDSAPAPAHPAAPPAPPRPNPPPAAALARAAPRKAPRPTFGPPPQATDRAEDWEAQLAAVAREACGCTRCGLSETRTKVVPGSGSGKVPLVFVGEAPGRDEDLQGEAFVGRAGQLLTKVTAAIGIDRRDVYICNVLKCRPPNNRNPLPDEIEACSPYLVRQLEILKPRVICTLGLFATQLLLNTKMPIGKLRGRLFKFRGIPLLPTYHPAALLRNPNLKRAVWEDVQLLRKTLDEGPPESLAEAAEKPSSPRAPTAPTPGDLFGE